MTDDPKPPHVWWSPAAGVLLRHPEDRDRFVAVTDTDGEPQVGGVIEWPADGKLLRAEHVDYRQRADMWQGMAERFGRDADARVARAEAAEARAVADAARYKAELLTLKADDELDDPKHRGPSYRRGESDGRLAAFADATDLTPVLANRSGLVDPAGELHGIAKDLDHPRWAETLNRIARAIRGQDQTDEQ